jgi:hypothetical protein
MLDGDELPGAVEASARFHGRPVPQFWDGAKKLGHEVGRSIGAPEWTAWDVYLFYPPGAEWTEDGLPPPAVALAQAGGVVVGTRGTLPPAGDQSRVPKRMIGRVDVVGEQSNLEALLRQVAEPFARRYPPGKGP